MIMLKMHVVPARAPDFKRDIDHFCVDVGGRAAVDGLHAHYVVALGVISPSQA